MCLNGRCIRLSGKRICSQTNKEFVVFSLLYLFFPISIYRFEAALLLQCAKERCMGFQIDHYYGMYLWEVVQLSQIIIANLHLHSKDRIHLFLRSGDHNRLQECLPSISTLWIQVCFSFLLVLPYFSCQGCLPVPWCRTPADWLLFPALEVRISHVYK